MRLYDLKALVDMAILQGIPEDSEVKILANHTIYPCVGYQMRKVQNYDADGNAVRNKYLLLSVVDVNNLSAT